MKQSWNPKSWQQKPQLQHVTYPDKDALNEVVTKLSSLPPLVTALEIERLKKQLATAALGEAFLLQGGDCAESFAHCNEASITNKLKILLQMSLVLIHGLNKPIIRVGRIAGQYAKPRSQDMETINGVTLPCYRGDLINQQGFTAAERIPQPELILAGYQMSSLTLNYIRALVDGGFANLEHTEYWNLDFAKHAEMSADYQRLVDSVSSSIKFLNTIAGVQIANIARVDFYTSHEALLLYYEQALTRADTAGRFYNLSTHFPWIGMRTAELEHAHVEYFRGISNPVAVKIGPGITADKLCRLLDVLHPENEPGRMTLIVRLGVKYVADQLPLLIETVKKSGKQVVWSCDPMHGNTAKTQQGIKTRRFDDILNELQQSFRIHREMNSHLGGVHFELTGDDVTECIGGARGITEADLDRAYESLVDPRLNYEQALEMALLIAREYKD